MQEKILTIDLGKKKSGFCIYSTEKDTPIQHGYMIASDDEGLFRVVEDLLIIAKEHEVERVIVEITNRSDTYAVKMRRICQDLAQAYRLPLTTLSAAEWRQSLHFYSKHTDVEEYKRMALKYVKDEFPDHYREHMPDDEAEAICIGRAYVIGLKKHSSCKQKRDIKAQAKKNYYKHVEKDEYEDYEESTKFWRHNR